MIKKRKGNQEKKKGFKPVGILEMLLI